MMMPTLRSDAHYRTPKGGQAERYDEQGIGGVSNFILPQGWTRITLEDVAEWSSGGTPSRSVPSYFTGSIPWIKTGELGEKYLYDTEEKISEEAINKSSAKVFPKGSIALAMYGATIGKLSIFSIKASTNQACAVAIPISEIIDTLFLFYFLHFQRQAFVDAGKGGAQPNISQGIIKAWLFNLPPRNEQTRIVEKLEELLSDLDAGVAELKAAQKKLTQYRQSLLKAAVEGKLTAEWRAEHAKRGEPLETGAQLLERILAERLRRWEEKQLAKFKEQGKTPPKDWRDKYPEPVKPNTAGLPKLPKGWVWASIEQIASDEPYSLAIGPFGSNLKVPDYRDAGVPLVFVRNIRSRKYNGINTRYVTVEKAEELSAHRIQAGDVLITKMGEPPGDADVYPSNQPPAIITADCIRVRCWQGFMQAHFLAAVINSHIGKQQIKPITQGVAQKKVSLGRFSSLAVPVPSMEEQGKIIEFLAAGEREAMAQEAAILRALKQSSAQRQNILKAAFSGQLVPQDPNDEPASVLLERIRAERAARESSGRRRGRKAREGAV